MDAAQIREVARVIIAAGGAVSIYCGYKLFCEIPFGRSRASGVINGLSGAALALFGMALLVGDVRGIQAGPVDSYRHNLQTTRPAEAGSFAAPPAGRRKAVSDWSI